MGYVKLREGNSIHFDSSLVLNTWICPEVGNAIRKFPTIQLIHLRFMHPSCCKASLGLSKIASFQVASPGSPNINRPRFWISQVWENKKWHYYYWLLALPLRFVKWFWSRLTTPLLLDLFSWWIFLQIVYHGIHHHFSPTFGITCVFW